MKWLLVHEHTDLDKPTQFSKKCKEVMAAMHTMTMLCLIDTRILKRRRKKSNGEENSSKCMEKEEEVSEKERSEHTSQLLL